MITSIVVRKNTNISFTKIEIDLETGKMMMKVAKYNLGSEELQEQIENNHRVCLPCRIKDNIASFYVPTIWDGECIENYTQALMDELYLLQNKLNGHKTIEQIENTFMLEMILL